MAADAPSTEAIRHTAAVAALVLLGAIAAPAVAQIPEKEPPAADAPPEQRREQSPEAPRDQPQPEDPDRNPGEPTETYKKEQIQPPDPAQVSPPGTSPDTPMEACSEREKSEATLLERVRRQLTVTACASSAWLDGLFGDQFHYWDYRATHGTVSAGGLWSKYDGFDPRLRFRVRLQLPQWNERISAFAGRVGEDDYISDTEQDFEALPTRQFGRLEDESVLVGLGYSSPNRTGNDFDAGVGVRVDLPLDPYGRVRYEVVRTFAERYVFSARETLFWQNSEGFGTTTRLNLDRALSDKLLLRWSNLGKFTEKTVGVEWYSQLTLYQSLTDRVGLAWQTQVEGATDNEVPLTRYAARVIMRRQMTPEWLYLEARAGVGWPRRKLTEHREISPELGLAFEMKFGNEVK